MVTSYCSYLYERLFNIEHFGSLYFNSETERANQPLAFRLIIYDNWCEFVYKNRNCTDSVPFGSVQLWDWE